MKDDCSCLAATEQLSAGTTSWRSCPGETKAKMVLSEHQEAGLICLALIRQHKEKLQRCQEQHEQELRRCQEQHLSDLSSILQTYFLLQQTPTAGFFASYVADWSTLPDPRPVLAKCFELQAPTQEWLRRLLGAVRVLFYPPHGSQKQKEFVRRAEESLYAAAATVPCHL